MTEPQGPGWERLLLAAAAVAITLTVVSVSCVAIIAKSIPEDAGDLPFYALIGVVVVVGALILRARGGTGPLHSIATLFPPQLHGVFRRRPVVSSLTFILALVALIQVSRLSCFMADPGLRWASAYPPVEFGVNHMCLPAYVYAAELSRDHDPNVYAEEHYPGFYSRDSAHVRRPVSTVKNLEPYLRDAFEYPPPFLILPRMALALTNDFFNIRTGWFMLQFLLFFALALALARFTGGSRGLVAGLLIPALLASFPFMFNFQFGQFHLVAIMFAVAGMLAFTRGWNRTGGALLGAAVVTKIFPGLLLLYLAFQRRKQPIIWTLAFSLLYVLAGLIVLGPLPYQSFFAYQIPRLMSGEAFSFNLTNDLTIATNGSISSIPFKLTRLGISGFSEQYAVALTWLYTIVIFGVTYMVSRRKHEAVMEPAIWLGLLTLGSLRSPDAPIVYVGASALWALTFLAVETRGRTWPVLLMVFAWMFTGVVPPLPTPEATIILWMVVQFVIPAVGFYVVLHRQNAFTISGEQSAPPGVPLPSTG